MRKITFSFLALLLTAVGAWAQSVTLKPSTDKDSPEFVYCLANSSGKLMAADTKWNGADNNFSGRFAFFKVEGKDDTYTIMSIDATGENKWLSYDDTNIGEGANKVSLAAEADAKMWQITSSTIDGKSFKGYQFRAYNSNGELAGQYMNWHGGPSTDNTAGFYWKTASADTGSGWVLTLAPMSGREYYIFDKTHSVYLSLTKLKNNLATTTSTPEKCKITRTDEGKWLVYTTGETPLYLGANGANTTVSADNSGYAWTVERKFDNSKGEFDVRLSNPAFAGNDRRFLGSLDHVDGHELWSNAPEIEAVEFKLMDGSTKFVDVKVQGVKTGDSEASYEATVKLPVGDNLDIRSFLASNGLLEYDAASAVKNVTEAENQTLTINYTETGVPFAGSFTELDENNKWVSFFTYNGRMHVYDDKCVYNGVKKYPSIDRATFAKLTDNKFWGFVCANPLVDYVKIVNKGATEDKGTLYLTVNDNDKPLLLATEKGTYVTNEWLILKGQTKSEDGKTVQYYSIKAKGTNKYINNFQGAGFMVTWKDGTSDKGSNIKFTSELDTYNLLKERALNAPYNAVHSLTAEARALITGNTVAEYKQAIEKIKKMDEEGVVKFDESKYYYLRNYTPAGGDTYVLDYKGETNLSTALAESGLGSASDEMTYFNANALWQITEADASDQGYTGSEDIGVSKTIGRKVTHLNSGKKLETGGYSTGAYFRVNDEGTKVYFVNLGAGQHFIKTKQYNGSGQQAKDMPISCDNNGALLRRANETEHFKNSRDTWYGIPVTSLYVTLNAGGDNKYYATAHFPFAVSIDAAETVKAYTVSDIDKENGVLNMTEVTGVIPAGTAMILIDENETAKVNILPAVTETAQASAILQGVNMARNFDADITADNVLVLGIGGTSSKVGFYLPATGSTGLRSNSAYIPVSALDGMSAANGLKFNFGGVASGIDGVNAGSNKGTVVYDLQGRRVNKLSKGLYIVNGKKVIL